MRPGGYDPNNRHLVDQELSPAAPSFVPHVYTGEEYAPTAGYPQQMMASDYSGGMQFQPMFHPMYNANPYPARYPTIHHRNQFQGQVQPGNVGTLGAGSHYEEEGFEEEYVPQPQYQAPLPRHGVTPIHRNRAPPQHSPPIHSPSPVALRQPRPEDEDVVYNFSNMNLNIQVQLNHNSDARTVTVLNAPVATMDAGYDNEISDPIPSRERGLSAGSRSSRSSLQDRMSVRGGAPAGGAAAGGNGSGKYSNWDQEYDEGTSGRSSWSQPPPRGGGGYQGKRREEPRSSWQEPPQVEAPPPAPKAFGIAALKQSGKWGSKRSDGGSDTSSNTRGEAPKWSQDQKTSLGASLDSNKYGSKGGRGGSSRQHDTSSKGSQPSGWGEGSQDDGGWGAPSEEDGGWGDVSSNAKEDNSVKRSAQAKPKGAKPPKQSPSTSGWDNSSNNAVNDGGWGASTGADDGGWGASDSGAAKSSGGWNSEPAPQKIREGKKAQKPRDDTDHESGGWGSKSEVDRELSSEANSRKMKQPIEERKNKPSSNVQDNGGWGAPAGNDDDGWGVVDTGVDWTTATNNNGPSQSPAMSPSGVKISGKKFKKKAERMAAESTAQVREVKNHSPHEDVGGWGAETSATDASGGWGAETSATDASGGWGSSTTSDATGDWGSSTAANSTANPTGGWDSQVNSVDSSGGWGAETSATPKKQTEVVVQRSPAAKKSGKKTRSKSPQQRKVGNDVYAEENRPSDGGWGDSTASTEEHGWGEATSDTPASTEVNGWGESLNAAGVEISASSNRDERDSEQQAESQIEEGEGGEAHIEGSDSCPAELGQEEESASQEDTKEAITNVADAPATSGGWGEEPAEESGWGS